jgi:hypothetical protein
LKPSERIPADDGRRTRGLTTTAGCSSGVRGVTRIRETTGAKPPTFREELARDMREVRRSVGPEYDSVLRDLLRYYRSNFPSLMAKRSFWVGGSFVTVNAHRGLGKDLVHGDSS